MRQHTSASTDQLTWSASSCRPLPLRSPDVVDGGARKRWGFAVHPRGGGGGSCDLESGQDRRPYEALTDVEAPELGSCKIVNPVSTGVLS